MTHPDYAELCERLQELAGFQQDGESVRIMELAANAIKALQTLVAELEGRIAEHNELMDGKCE